MGLEEKVPDVPDVGFVLAQADSTPDIFGRGRLDGFPANALRRGITSGGVWRVCRKCDRSFNK